MNIRNHNKSLTNVGIWLQMIEEWSPKGWCWFLASLTSKCWLLEPPMLPGLLWTNLGLKRLVDNYLIATWLIREDGIVVGISNELARPLFILLHKPRFINAATWPPRWIEGPRIPERMA